MNKYVIKNCPAFVQSSYKNRDWAIENACELIDDRCCIKQNCVLKQIVEKCKLFQNNYLVNDGVQLLTTNILNSLDIQECE